MHYLKHLLARVRVHWHHMVHRGHEMFHLIYLGAVSIEAHGWYGKAAIGLFLFTVLAHFLGEGVE